MVRVMVRVMMVRVMVRVMGEGPGFGSTLRFGFGWGYTAPRRARRTGSRWSPTASTRPPRASPLTTLRASTARRRRGLRARVRVGLRARAQGGGALGGRPGVGRTRVDPAGDEEVRGDVRLVRRRAELVLQPFRQHLATTQHAAPNSADPHSRWGRGQDQRGFGPEVRFFGWIPHLDARLARVVSEIARRAREPLLRPRVDDQAARLRLDHRRHEGLAHVEHAKEVDVEVAPPRLEAAQRRRRADAGARVVHQQRDVGAEARRHCGASYTSARWA
eukprot:2644730-Prymnesium_polylepis.2